MMYRSASWNKFSDDYFKHATSSSSSSSISPGQRSSNDLPTYDPIVELAKKEKARVKFSENAVHVIPFVLLLCAIILWIFSNPEVGMLGDPIGARIEGLSLDGEMESDSDGTQAGVLPIMGLEEISTKELGAEKYLINLKNFK
ncbi:transmembrane protein, putative [Medicago truncatula]|uniref:Transmembrane protein, putative n=2 Tax=Medicago truncatula TaxID=3880 RepID=G7I2Z4_MEDTR|nr:transmembrane protein, putative [Medicago truncatula]